MTVLGNPRVHHVQLWYNSSAKTHVKADTSVPPKQLPAWLQASMNGAGGGAGSIGSPGAVSWTPGLVNALVGVVGRLGGPSKATPQAVLAQVSWPGLSAAEVAVFIQVGVVIYQGVK